MGFYGHTGCSLENWAIDICLKTCLVVFEAQEHVKGTWPVRIAVKYMVNYLNANANGRKSKPRLGKHTHSDGCKLKRLNILLV